MYQIHYRKKRAPGELEGAWTVHSQVDASTYGKFAVVYTSEFETFSQAEAIAEGMKVATNYEVRVWRVELMREFQT